MRRTARWALRAGLGLSLVVAVPLLWGCFVLSTPRYAGPASEHFDGERFGNGAPRPTGLADMLRWQRTRTPGPWRSYQDFAPGPPPPRRVDEGVLRVTFVNHATVLVQQDGVNVLTDPIWSERASPLSFVGPKRARPPGLRFEDLPPLDAIVVSHNHYDHMDLPTLKRLRRAFPRAPIVVGIGNAPLLTSKGLSPVIELDWWKPVKLGPLTVVGAKTQHFSNRGLLDADGALWLGFVLETAHARTYFGGDTAYGPHFAEARRRLGPMRLAILPIGAFRPEWFMGPVHMSPAQAVQAHQDLEAGASVAMHFGTFQLADDGQDEPVQALRSAVEAKRPPQPFWVLGFGEGREVP